MDRGGRLGPRHGGIERIPPPREVPPAGDAEMTEPAKMKDAEKEVPVSEDVEMADASPVVVVAPKEDEVIKRSPTPIMKAEKDLDDEEEEEDKLTQEDVISKIAEIDKELDTLEKNLQDLDARKAAVEAEPEQKEEPEVPAIITDLPMRHEEEAEDDLHTGGSTPDLSPSISSTVSDTPSTTSEEEGGVSVETESDAMDTREDSVALMAPGLPYYTSDPIKKLEDLEFFQSNVADHDEVKDLMLADFAKHQKNVFEKQKHLKRKYKELYGDWNQRCQEFDRESTRSKKKGAVEPVERVMSPALSANEPQTRRRGGNVPTGDVVRSEAEMQQVLANLQEAEAEEAAKSKLEGPKEARLPDMILDDREKNKYQDTNRLLRTQEEVHLAYRYEVPPDNWNDDEQQKFIDLYIQFPKQWHKIAAGFPDRDFKACIRHYYLTKKQSNYKDLLNKSKRMRKRRGGRAAPAKSRQSALLADLGKGKGAGRGEDDDGENTEDATPAPNPSTRPRRAAAPVFGEGANNRNGYNNGGDNDDRKGAKEVKEEVEGQPELKEKGTKRTRGGNNGGREKANKRVKAPPVTPAPQPIAIAPVAPAPTPIVVEKKPPKPKTEDLRTRESDAASVLAGLSGPREDVKPVIPVQIQSVLTARPPAPQQQQQQPPQQVMSDAVLPPQTPQQTPLVRTPAHTPQPGQRPPSSTPKKEKDKAGLAATSSYWSVPEQTDFPHLLASFGTNWGAISSRLASKTTVMVCLQSLVVEGSGG